MRIGIVAESAAGETRIAATPAVVEQLRALGYDVVVETGAGVAASFADEAFAAAGAAVAPGDDVWSAEIVLKINAPASAEIARLADHGTLISLIGPAFNPALLDELAQRNLTVLAMDAVPRISRAQSMDVLSSMANIAGYRAVVEAVHVFGRFLAGQITAAGKVPPAKVLVAGAGVAGLAAIRTASGMGAIVRATDPRAEVADQVKSVGGEFIPVDVQVEQSTDGYAKATSEAYDRRAAEIYAEQCADVDIVITTASIPGRPAPRLISAADVARMKSGSVIVDLAAARGGNVEGTVPGDVVHTPNGVTIIGYADLATRLPAQASQLYGTNVVNLLKLLTPVKDGRLTLDLDDSVQRSVLVVQNGAKTWPPPPVEVSVAVPSTTTPAAAAPTARPPASPALRWTLVGLGIVLLFLVTALAPDPIPEHFTVFVLAIVVGFYVIGKVHHALHTPLMSITNAISGIIVLGAMVQIGYDSTVVRVLAFLAILVAGINVFGGFAVTRRMLRMFVKAERP